MHQPKPAERYSEGQYFRDSWSMRQGWEKSEKLPFDFRRMFAAITLYIGSSTVRRGYFCDVVMNPQVPRYLNGHPGMLQELICSFADHCLAKMKNGGLVIKVDSVPLNNGKSHFVIVEISDTDQAFCGRCTALEAIIERHSETKPYFPGDRSSWISWERQLKKPLNGRILVQSLHGWGSRYRIEFELESLDTRGDFTNPH